MKRIGIIGAFVAAGTPLLVAARLAEAILAEFSESDGEAPSGLDVLARELPTHEIAALPGEANDYWYHRALCRHPKLYQPGKALPTDVLVEIVDRQLVFSPLNSGLKTRTASGLRVAAPFSGWIEGWERGAAARVVLVYEKLGLMDDATNPEWRALAGRYEMEAQHARENALGKLTVNVSLAIRTALDRVAAHRAPDRTSA